MSRPQLSYTPAPHEQQYYEGLFQTADVSRGGNIGGSEAVAFFSRSKLQVTTLKSIWTLADQPVTNSLDRKKFATAIRLIQLSQNGLKAQGANLGGPPGMRPAMFEGVSGVMVQLPPPEPPVGVPQAVGAPPHPQQGMNPPQQNIPPQQNVPPQQDQRRESFSVAPSIPSAPSSPGGSRASFSMPPSMSTALTTQDPYLITSQEESRYGEIFPTYAKDGYIYGKEAVALFTKSGVPQDQLKKIWNMVDTPVDNRLDKMEFVFAMHLIVCVSKKGLPLPSSLPVSLKNLKSQPTSMENSAQGFPPPQAQDNPPNVQNNANRPPTQELQAPESFDNPKPQTMSISDAFDGMSPDTALQGYGQTPKAEPSQDHGPPPQAVPEVNPAPVDAGASTSFQQQMNPTQMSFQQPANPAQTNFQHPANTVIEPSPQVTQQMIPEPVEIKAPPSEPAQKLADSYNMADDMTELAKLKNALLKLQAENISLKAQMGSMTEEEKEVKKETIATIDAITQLSTELVELREQVSTAKLRLMASTAELMAAKEKKASLSHLITETRETYETLQDVSNNIQNVNEQLQAAPPAPPAPVGQPDLFGGWNQPAPTNTSTPAVAPPIPDSNPPLPDVNRMNPGNMPPGHDLVPPVPTDGAPQTLGMVPPIPNDAPPPPYGVPPNPAIEQQSADSWGIPAPMANTAPNIVETASDDFGAAPLGSDTSSLPPGYSAPETFTQQFQPPSGGLNQAVMGGGPAPSVSLQRNDVEELKNSAMQSQQTSQEADETYRTLVSEVEKLKTVAESAEAEAMRMHEKASKKRGMGKKKATKEAEQASMEAAEKKKLYLELQAQASNAQALAMESKRQTEKLRDEAEQAELTYVSAQSTKEAQHNNPGQLSNTINSDLSNDGGLPAPSQMQTYPNYNNNINYQQTQADTNGYGNGNIEKPSLEPGSSFSFGAGIMGGGGGGGLIPTPQQAGMMGGGGGGAIPAPQQMGMMGGGGGGTIPDPQQADAYANPFQ